MGGSVVGGGGGRSSSSTLVPSSPCTGLGFCGLGGKAGRSLVGDSWSRELLGFKEMGVEESLELGEKGEFSVEEEVGVV